MDLYRLNLSLLVALDALFTEKSVTLAAKKLFITQAAMSNNLQQLREIFKDDLLLREKNQMVLTHYANELQPKLHQVIEELRSLVSSGKCFDPNTSSRIFKIGMSDYMATWVLPKLTNLLEAHAPGVKLNIIPTLGLAAKEEFQDKGFELVVGKMFDERAQLCKQLLFACDVVCILHPGHPLASKENITIDEYLAYQHVAICPANPNVPSLVEQTLANIGVKRNVKVAVPYSVSVFQLISSSRTLIGTALENTAKFYQSKFGYIIKALPFVMDKADFHMMWHPRSENDAGHIWLREQIIKACS